MAIRPIYTVSNNDNALVETHLIDFEWFPGFSIVQKQKSIASLHSSIKDKLNINEVLDISSKSPNPLGVELSAFNLTIETKKLKKSFTVECAFQASKVFEFGGPYVDLLDVSSIEAKKDHRIRSSGKLLKFKFYDTEWKLEPKTAFYDWLYINALCKNDRLAKKILNYRAFSDIEFNHEKSINCQAYSAALFISLWNRNLLSEAVASPDSFLNIISKFSISGAHNMAGAQGSLL